MVITDRQFRIACESAGLKFIVDNAKRFASEIEKINHLTYKKKIIDEIYNNGNGPDSKETGTETRVNCLIRIINSGRLDEAIKKASVSKKLGYLTCKKAIDLLNEK